jgi:HNH endonuclease
MTLPTTTATTTPAATTATTTPAARQAWPTGSRRRPGGCPRSWVGPDPALELGRTTRVVQPAQRVALAVRDGGGVFPGCERPLAWCEAHHIQHWLDGGPTDLANLVLLCRAHHRAVHEGGWRLARLPDGRLTTTPRHRRPHVAA